MAFKNYTIELRTDFDEEGKDDIMLELMREQCRIILTTAMMLKEKRDPTLALKAGDLWEREKDFEIVED